LPSIFTGFSVYYHRPIKPIYLSIYLWLYSPLLGLALFFGFFIFYTVGRTPWTEDQAFARPLPSHRTAQLQNKRTQTSMPQVGFEPTIPVFERAKTVHVLDRAATSVGRLTKPTAKYVSLTLCAYTSVLHVQRLTTAEHYFFIFVLNFQCMEFNV
jgi:hypothetical protein